MGCDEHALARHDARSDLVKPEGEHSVDGEGERLSTWQCLLWHGGVERIVGRVALIGGFDGRGRHIEAAAPNLDLVVAVLLGGLRLVEALQATVVPLIQAPVVDDGHGKVLALCADSPGSANGTTQDGGEDDVELVALLLQALARLDRLLNSICAEVDIVPTGEDVGNIPLALTVADEDDFVCWHCSCCLAYDDCFYFPEPVCLPATRLLEPTT
mmetsp:Transcript_14124/g.33313  ORF Transcript_14124/g.33313 Transcript_14124/m.33313 type:complete len:214 (+) Transcript_14124:374-1015(+)